MLPLANVGGDVKHEYFSDGMTDELATALGRIPGLRVASRTSSYTFKGKSVDVAQIGRALHVETVLEGTVRREGDRLRVSVQLTKVSDGLALWSDTYERPATRRFPGPGRCGQIGGDGTLPHTWHPGRPHCKPGTGTGPGHR